MPLCWSGPSACFCSDEMILPLSCQSDPSSCWPLSCWWLFSFLGQLKLDSCFDIYLVFLSTQNNTLKTPVGNFTLRSRAGPAKSLQFLRQCPQPGASIQCYAQRQRYRTISGYIVRPWGGVLTSRSPRFLIGKGAVCSSIHHSCTE